MPAARVREAQAMQLRKFAENMVRRAYPISAQRMAPLDSGFACAAVDRNYWEKKTPAKAGVLKGSRIEPCRNYFIRSAA
jgi:hypothetical protein